MGWLTHSFRKYLSEGRYETYEQYLTRVRRDNAPPRNTTVDRAAQLEEDLARAVLMIHTLVEACVRKGGSNIAASVINALILMALQQ